MEMGLKISSDNYNVLQTGTVMSFYKDSPINLFCKFTEVDFGFEVEFSFIDTDTNEIGLEKRVEEGNKIILECKNFKNGLGTGTTNPFELATVNNKKLYINFCITKLDSAPRVLHYTFFIER